MTTADANEDTKMIKLLTKEKKLMKNLNRNLRHLTNQGLKEQLTQYTTFTQINDAMQIQSAPIHEIIEEESFLKMEQTGKKKRGRPKAKDSKKRKMRSSEIDERN